VDLALIYNGRAGSAAGVEAGELATRIADATAREVTLLDVRDDCDPDACAQAAADANARTIVAAGGDGTVSACAKHVIGRDAELGVLPIGTSNSFAAALDIPAALDAAIAQLASTNRRTIDAAIVTSATTKRVMILHCMIGLHAAALAETSTSAKRRWGVLAYVATALRKLATLQPFSCELVTSGHTVHCRASAIAAANIAPLRTVLAHGPSHLLADDGRIDVTIVAGETLSEAIATGIHLYRTTRDHEPATRDNIGSFSTDRLVIRTEPPQQVLVDGEPVGHTPITIETLPRVLRVIAPAVPISEGPPIEAELVGLPELEVDVRVPTR
jgi:YegS/Rv2252/BmrU family lipid kinase